MRVATDSETRVTSVITPTFDDVPGLAAHFSARPRLGRTRLASELTRWPVSTTHSLRRWPTRACRVAVYAAVDTEGPRLHYQRMRQSTTPIAAPHAPPLAMEMLREIDEEKSISSRTTRRVQWPSRFCRAGSRPARQRLGRHCRRHGHQHSAAQPARQLAEAVYWCLENHQRSKRPHGPASPKREGTPTSPPRLVVAPKGDTLRVHQGPRALSGCRIGGDRGRLARPYRHRHHRAAVSGQHDNFITSIADQVRDGKKGLCRPLQPSLLRAVTGSHPIVGRAQARRSCEGGAEQPLQGTPSCRRSFAPTCFDRRRGTAHAAARLR